MKFEFTTTNKVDTVAWSNINDKLEKDLHELTTTQVPEEAITTYLMALIQALKPVDNARCEGMLFLMHDAPASMPADARVEFVYKPTYIAATILMTAMNRFESVAADPIVRKVTREVLQATMGRDFVGAGYEEYTGFIDTLRIFAHGDTVAFLRKFPEINAEFACKLEESLISLETEICSGKIKDLWSGDDYSEKGKAVLAMYQNQKATKSTHVWYACYGSNLSKARFMDYIGRCADSTPPAEDRPFVFEHPIYFAKSTSRWQNGGKAFLDDSRTGTAYGRIYKITKEQYEEVKSREGSDYTKVLSLGEVDGLPVYSFTDTQVDVPKRAPSNEYFCTILTGLKECYSGILSYAEMVNYLIDAILPENTFSVARAIKEKAHYMTNAEISFSTGLKLTEVLSATSWLVAHAVIQQDQRSIRAGHRIDSPEAFFFTVDGPCGRGLIATMIASLQAKDHCK